MRWNRAKASMLQASGVVLLALTMLVLTGQFAEAQLGDPGACLVSVEPNGHACNQDCIGANAPCGGRACKARAGCEKCRCLPAKNDPNKCGCG